MTLEISQDKIWELMEQNTSLQVGLGILLALVILLIGVSIFLCFLLDNNSKKKN